MGKDCGWVILADSWSRGKGPDFIEKSERTRKARLLDPRSQSSSWPASFKEDLVTCRSGINQQHLTVPLGSDSIPGIRWQ